MGSTETHVMVGARPVAAHRLLALALVTSSLMLTGFAVVLEASGGADPIWEVLGSVAVLAVTSGVGLLIALRREGSPIGWILLATALVLSFDALASPYAYYGLISHPGSLPAARFALLWNESDWPTLFAGVTVLAYVFPDGRLPSERWRVWAKLAAAAFLGLIAILAVSPEGFESPFKSIRSPLPRLPEELRVVQFVFFLGVIASLVGAAWASRVRFRRASGTEREQLLWFAYAALLIPLGLLACIADQLLTGSVGALTAVAVFAVALAVPVCVGIAILRHQLFDIELVISRTLVYAALTAFVVALYALVVAGLGGLIDQRGISGLLAAGLVAACVQPLRLRLQRRVERLVYGDRTNPYAALSRLDERLQATLAPEEVVKTIVDSVAEALRLPYVAIEFERGGALEVAASSGRPGRRSSERLALRYQGAEVGSLTIHVPPGRELTAADRRLLGDLVQHAGVAVHATRLTADLQRSREQLVTTREEERRRLRRDLHDGLGPALAAIALKASAAHDRVSDEDAVGQLLTQLSAEAKEAVGDIRRLVDGLRPPAIDELGLLGALREQASRLSSGPAVDRSTPSVSLLAPGSLPSLPAAVEVAAYRIVLEALTNVVRHAAAQSCVVRLSVSEGQLQIEVSDDGRGMPAAPTAGVGLRSMRERAEELGGGVEVGRAPSGGTEIRARLPLARQ